jgi:hypothetical protein
LKFVWITGNGFRSPLIRQRPEIVADASRHCDTKENVHQKTNLSVSSLWRGQKRFFRATAGCTISIQIENTFRDRIEYDATPSATIRTVLVAFFKREPRQCAAHKIQ